MNRQLDRSYRFDWPIIVIYLMLVFFGWLNIMSASHTGEITNFFDMSQPYGKQAVFIVLAFILIAITLSLEAKFYERFASIIYLISLLSLVGLFLFGKNVNGATSWYGIGGMTLQPSEFAKFATALAVAKYISDLETDLTTIKDQVRTMVIILLPAFLILLQNDAGSTLVYGAFFFVLYREGIQQIYLIALATLVGIAVITLKFGILTTVLILVVLGLMVNLYLRKRKPPIIPSIVILLISSLLAVSVSFFYKSILKPHQQDRISLWLRLEKDPDKIQQMKQTILYNLNESEKAISSGGFKGKGYLEGTRTTGKFVPEQHTDYIFSTVGEEWGFLGSSIVVILFVLLIGRVVVLAESQKSQFSRVYGYSVAAIFFIHFLINVGMVMGLIPTVGIPLPFFSYGGSALWGFTILLFIFVKLDSNKINEW
ncbi:rod shape-determining protein RodA [Winogradskyella aurantiaca]|uniref:rod shape-determining protein RodA n=1 Tax=Winogradskyella aurantiaca TaxID=2219558 RepID=UPI000E1CFB44|nr:rod shape-determining protein RodA [Winogradskyella aurantiaca]